MSYDSLEDLLDDVCKAYFRYVDYPDSNVTNYHQLTYTYTSGSVTRTNNGDFYTKVTSQTGLSSDFMFFFKPDSTYVYLIFNHENTCKVIGVITISSLEFKNDTETTSGITVSLTNSQITISGYVDPFTITATATDYTATLLKEGFNIPSFSTSTDIASNPPKINTTIQDLCIYVNGTQENCVIDKALYYTMTYKYKNETGASESETLDRPNGLPSTLPSNMIYANDNYYSMPSQKLEKIGGNFTIIYFYKDSANKFYIFKLEGKIESNVIAENTYYSFKGSFGPFNSNIQQNINVNMIIVNGNYSLNLGFENGFEYPTVCTISGTLVLFIPTMSIECSTYTDIRELLYTANPDKTVNSGKCMYMECASKYLKEAVTNYSSFPDLYKYSNGDETTDMTNGYLKGRDLIVLNNDKPLVLRLGEDVHYYYKEGSSLTSKQLISDGEALNRDDEVSCTYKLSDVTEYFINTNTSNIQFRNNSRYFDLQCQNMMIKVGNDDAVNIFDVKNVTNIIICIFSNSKFICTLKEYDLFVSYCMVTSPMFLVDSTNRYPYTISSTEDKYETVEDYKLALYNNGESIKPAGFSPVTGETLLTSVITTKLYGSNNWTSDHIVYIRVKFTNIDATSSTVYFDTDATSDDTRYMFFILDGSKKDNDGKMPLYILSQEGTLVNGVPTADTKPTLRRYTCKMASTKYLKLTNISFDGEEYGVGYISFGSDIDDYFTTNIAKDIFPPNASDVSSFNVMAVYDKIVTNDPPTSKISLYTNKFYLEDGEFVITDYQQNLYAKVGGTGNEKAQLTGMTDLNYTAYSYYYVSYYLKDSKNEMRLFTVRYHLNSTSKKIEDITLFRFSNKDNAKLERIQNIEMNADYDMGYTKDGTNYDEYTAGFTKSTLDLDITIKFDSSANPMYSITYKNEWYNYWEKSNSATLLAFIGTNVEATV